MATVVGLGIMFVVMLAVMVGTIISRMMDDAPAPRVDAPAALDLQLPATAEFQDMQFSGERLVVRMRENGTDLLIIIDTKKVQEIARVKLN